MGQNWKPIDRVREYGNQTEKVETSEFPNEPTNHFIHNCNLITCRYNADGKCTNEEKRKECVRVSKAVLLIDDFADIEVTDNQCTEKKNPLNICRTNQDCEFDPEYCGFAVDCTVNGDLPNRIYMCGRDKCKYQK